MSVSAQDQTVRLIGGVKSAVAVTKSDSTEFEASRALWIGTAGDLTVDMVGTGTNVTITNVPAGILPFQVTRVYSTGTTASGIFRLN